MDPQTIPALAQPFMQYGALGLAFLMFIGFFVGAYWIIKVLVGLQRGTNEVIKENTGVISAHTIITEELRKDLQKIGQKMDSMEKTVEKMESKVDLCHQIRLGGGAA